jgi:1,4-dihydroxy-2-naphthoyl-CoA hydrolase
VSKDLDVTAGQIFNNLTNLIYYFAYAGGFAMGNYKIKAGMLNPFGTVHAGAMLWLADVTVTSFLLRNTLKDKSFPVTVNLYTNLLSALREGEITAKSKIVGNGKRVSVVRITGNDNQLLAEVTTTHIKSRFQS